MEAKKEETKAAVKPATLPQQPGQPGQPYIQIKWQDGVVKDGKPNGAQIEEVLDLCIARLEKFQAGPMACRENAKTIAYLIQAKKWQQQRTRRRKEQGVEGTETPHKS